MLALIIVALQSERIRAKPLHDERHIQHSAVIREGAAQRREYANRDLSPGAQPLRIGSTVARGNHVARQTLVREQLKGTARSLTLVALEGVDERGSLRRETKSPLVELVQVIVVAHRPDPDLVKSGLRFSMKAS